MNDHTNKTVCVTGASGFIGSWLVSFLLQRGYRVRGTVQNLGDDTETQHLLRLKGANSQLELFQADLLDYDALASAIGQSDGVFHVASPCNLDPPEDPKSELLDPAVEGTRNVLNASHAANVKRVVVTSSVSAMFPNPNLPPDTVSDESVWTDIEFCEKRGAWYPVSKTLAEKAAWEIAGQTGLDVVVINPGCVLGKMLPPRLNASLKLLLNLMQGVPDTQELTWLGIVHVQDIARAHVLLYETPSAKGRHLCTDAITHFSDFAEQVAQMYPQYNVFRFQEDTHPDLVRCSNPSKKLLELGFTFTSGQDAIQDAVLSFKKNGLLLPK